MGQFKPMTKMMTTEPSVELKLKKGGSVNLADGGSMPMRRPMPAMPMRRPMPAAMPAAMPMARRGMPTPVMKEGGKADMAQDKAMIKKAMKQHDMQEHKGGKGTSLKLKTGGVPDGQGGFKKGGGVKKYAKGGMIDSGRPEQMPQGKKKPTPPVAINQLAGTFKKGGIAKC
jgi:hypothetical protein